jgi:hypothetical protein
VEVEPEAGNEECSEENQQRQAGKDADGLHNNLVHPPSLEAYAWKRSVVEPEVMRCRVSLMTLKVVLVADSADGHTHTVGFLKLKNRGVSGTGEVGEVVVVARD